MKTRIALSSLFAAAAIATACNAEFFSGQEVAINGVSYPPPFSTQWGSNFGPLHQLGGATVYQDPNFPGQGFDITVTSTVNDPWSVTFTIDFNNWGIADFSAQSIEILGLKSDGSIIDVAGNCGAFATDGNGVSWFCETAALADAGGVLTFKVYQEPAPGALALLAMAGAFGSRRRRS